MLQKEAVRRLNAKHGTKEYNALSIFLKAAFSHVQTHPVSRQCFFPIPGIDSVLVQMDRLQKPFHFNQEDRSLIRRIFTQRRKQIGSLIKKEEPNVKERINRWLESNELARNLRPEQIEAKQWQLLAESES